ncbi:MAG TPA: MlaD family protein, partial [Gemmatimonadaceae bacterium]|nr:MlaD family protein [Gemmatimonadaceae bacterium]
MKRRDEVLVGILMTITLVIGILGALWLARGGLSAGYPLHTRFAWGAGLKQGGPVLLAGVSVGYVDDVQLRNDGYLDVTFRVENRYRIPEGSVATVVPVGIFGDVAVALTPARVTEQHYQPGDTIPTGASPPGLTELVARMDTIGRSMSDVTQAIEFQLVQEGGLADLRSTIALTNQLVMRLNTIAAEQARELSATTAALRRTASAIDSAAVDSTMRALQASSQNLARMFEELTTTTETLTSIVAKVDTGAGNLGRLVN